MFQLNNRKWTKQTCFLHTGIFISHTHIPHRYIQKYSIHINNGMQEYLIEPIKVECIPNT